MREAKTRIDRVEKIGCMMEYMMLTADPTLFEEGSNRGHPVPSGVPMGIITLPDLVVDVKVHRKESSPLDVGGRAGRLARVLQEFGGPRRGWYNVKYVAKAGDVGSVLLRRRFRPAPSASSHKRADDRRQSESFEPLSLRYILSSPGDNDWLNVRRAGSRIESKPVDLDVSLASIEASSYTIKDLLADARYIAISSKRSDYAVKAVTLLREGLKKLPSAPIGLIPIGILLDFSALRDDTKVDRIIREFAALKESAKSKFDLECTALCQESPKFDPQLFEFIIIRNGSKFRRFNSLIKHTHRAPSKDKPVKREALTAGYVLASACSLGWKLLRQWYTYFPCLRPISKTPHDGFPRRIEEVSSQNMPDESGRLPSLEGNDDPIPIADRIEFANRLAGATAESPVTYRDLLKSLRGKPSSASAHDVSVTAKHYPSGEATRDPSLVPRFSDAAHQQTLSLFLSPSALKSPMEHISRANPKSGKIEKAVMFDLDATLLDPEGMRKACWLKGLEILFREAEIRVEPEPLRTAVKVYERFVYKQSEKFHSLLKDNPDIPPEWQPCDFRQVWNHHYAWAALLWFLDLGSNDSPTLGQSKSWILPSGLKEALALHDQQDSAAACSCIACRKSKVLFRKGDNREVQKLRKVLTRFRFAIQAARNSFWDIDYPCYPQARACVETLRSLPGYEVYVVTEGHEETQLQKVKCSGLADLFSRERVLSTGAASAAEEARNDLAKLHQFHDRVVNDFKRTAASAKAASNIVADLSKKYNAALESITFLNDLLSVLYSKAHKRFYSAVIIAICLNPQSPMSVLQSFSDRRRQEIDARHERNTHSIQFFMVGDRYDNDCRPLLEMDPATLSQATSSEMVPAETVDEKRLHRSDEINENRNRVGFGTCRLLSGKRAREHCPPKGKPQPPSTMLVCDTLAQVAHVLQKPCVWERIAERQDVLRPVLLEQQNGGPIMYRPIKSTPKDADPFDDDVEKPVLVELAPKFKELCWARANDNLGRERVVDEMLDQIERDLAVSDPSSLVSFLDVVKTELDHLWRTPDELGVGLLQGGLRVLSGINSWRQSLGVAFPTSKREPSETLEWLLGSYLLCIASIPQVRIDSLPLSWADEPSTPQDFRVLAKAILDAMPYSRIGKNIIDALKWRKDIDFSDELYIWVRSYEQASKARG